MIGFRNEALRPHPLRPRSEASSRSIFFFGLPQSGIPTAILRIARRDKTKDYSLIKP